MLIAIAILVVLGIICLALLSGIVDRQDAAQKDLLKDKQDRLVASCKAMMETTTSKDYFTGYWQHFSHLAGLQAPEALKLEEAFHTFAPKRAEIDNIIRSLSRENFEVVAPIIDKRLDALDSEIASFLGSQMRMKHNDHSFVKRVDDDYFKLYTGMSFAEMESKILN